VAYFRAVVLGLPLPWFSFLKATLFSTIVFAAGLTYFRRTEGGFADII